MFTLNYKDNRSLNQQIKDGLKELIVTGVMEENEQLPSVRELSVSLTVNPNTVQRAYKELEAEGYIYSLQGKGSFVAPPVTGKDNVNRDELYKSLVSIAKELAYMGDSKEDLINVINKVFSEKEENQ